MSDTDGIVLTIVLAVLIGGILAYVFWPYLPWNRKKRTRK